MSYLDTLLQGVEVEWKTLGEALVRTKGTNITAGEMKELHKDGAPLKIFAGGKTIAFVNYDDIPSKDINREPSIIVKSRGVIEFEYYDKPFSHKNEMWSYHSQNPDLEIKFVYYYLKIQEPYFQNIAGRMQMPQISIPDTDKYKIPIPPLPIQQKIVGILDKFTELTAELTAELTTELTARKQQYNYYREQLLSENGKLKMESGKWEWKTLGEVAEYSSKRISSSSVDKSNYVGVDNLLQNREGKTESNYVPTKGNLIGYSVGDILIGNIRPYLKKIWHSDRNGGTNGDVLVIHLIDKRISSRYLYQILADDKFFSYNMQHAKGAKMPRGNKGEILNYRFPIPSPEEQERIVSILDQFDTLTTSLTEGLPKEIALRKQQYEYYRNQLLTFNGK